MTEGSIHTGSEPGDQERHEHTSTNNEIHTPSRANFLNYLFFPIETPKERSWNGIDD